MEPPLAGTMYEFRAVAFRPTWHFEPGMLRRLEKQKLVDLLKVFARPPVPVAEPLAVIHPGDELPDWAKVAWTAQRRLQPPREYTVVRASQRGVNIYGGSVVRWNPLQVFHDAMKAEAFEAWRAAGRRTDLWVGEHRLGKLAKLLPKVPDAFVVGEPVTIVEVIGDYPASRIRNFVESLNGYEFEIELW